MLSLDLTSSCRILVYNCYLIQSCPTSICNQRGCPLFVIAANKQPLGHLISGHHCSQHHVSSMTSWTSGDNCFLARLFWFLSYMIYGGIFCSSTRVDSDKSTTTDILLFLYLHMIIGEICWHGDNQVPYWVIMGHHDPLWDVVITMSADFPGLELNV